MENKDILNLVIDGHNDLAWRIKTDIEDKYVNERYIDISQSTKEYSFQTDIDRLRKGQVGAQFWSVYIPTDTKNLEQETLRQIDRVTRFVDQNQWIFNWARDSEDLKRIISHQKRIGCLMGAEGGHCINNSLALLRMYRKLGVLYMTLTHNGSNDWADSSMTIDGKVQTELKHPPYGITFFGREIIFEMNRIGMMVDLSHTASECAKEVLKISAAPCIFSHSNAQGVCNHPRNVNDENLKLLKQNKGIIMVTFVAPFVKTTDDSSKITVKDVADHIDYIKNLIGIEHIGIGGDFDGTKNLISDLQDVSKYPNLTKELLNRGYTQVEVNNIYHNNLIRVLEDVELVCDNQRFKLPSLREIYDKEMQNQ